VATLVLVLEHSVENRSTSFRETVEPGLNNDCLGICAGSVSIDKGKNYYCVSQHEIIMPVEEYNSLKEVCMYSCHA